MVVLPLFRQHRMAGAPQSGFDEGAMNRPFVSAPQQVLLLRVAACVLHGEGFALTSRIGFQSGFCG